MITSLRVSGFKSLRNFSLKLTPGLNVLVGPNGAGKSNIIEFVEFFSHLASGGLSEAIGRLGGAGRLLSKISDKGYAREIRIRIEGEKIVGPGRDSFWTDRAAKTIPRRELGRVRRAHYAYNIVVKFTQDLTYIGSETLDIWLSPVASANTPRISEFGDHPKRPDLHVDRHGGAGTEKPRTSIRHSRNLRTYLGPKALSGLVSDLREYVFNDMSTEELAFGSDTFLNDDILEAIAEDFSFEPRLNVVPHRVREPMDISSTPGIQEDG
jgi:energy-coupling factor transporter ATP-binding protein EcfA2